MKNPYTDCLDVGSYVQKPSLRLISRPDLSIGNRNFSIEINNAAVILELLRTFNSMRFNNRAALAVFSFPSFWNNPRISVNITTPGFLERIDEPAGEILIQRPSN
jgi:hypothetical protein